MSQPDRIWMALMQSDQVPWTLKHQGSYFVGAMVALLLVIVSLFLWGRAHKRNQKAFLRYLVMWLLTFGSFLVIVVVALLVWLLPDSLLWFLRAEYIAQLHPVGVSHLIDLLFFAQRLVIWNLLLALGFTITIPFVPSFDRLRISRREEESASAAHVSEDPPGSRHASEKPTNRPTDADSKNLTPLEKQGGASR